MIRPGQVPVGTAPALLLSVPPGPFQVAITNAGTATVYVGSASAVTSLTGAPLASGGAITLADYPGSGGTTLYAATASGSATTGVWLVTPG
jgi:hypothetical protein